MLFNQFNLYNNKLIKGWFQETLPKIEVKNIALLHLDGD